MYGKYLISSPENLVNLSFDKYMYVLYIVMTFILVN